MIGRRGERAMRTISTALLIAVLCGLGAAAEAQIETIQLSPNVGLDFATSGWTPFDYALDLISSSGVLGFDRGSSLMNVVPGGSI